MITAFKYCKYILETDKKALERFKWAGNAFIYAAALAVAVSINFAQEAWPFIFYLVGATFWVIAAWIIKDKPLFWLNLFFILIDGYGAWLRW